MSEAEDLLAVYGAIDIAVQDDDTGESRARVAALLPHYESPEVHWYRDFLKWRRDVGVELPESLGEAQQSVGLALQNLEGTQPGSNRLAARRVLALYALALARDDVFGIEGEFGDQAQGALAAVLRQRLGLGEEGAGRANEAARRLYESVEEDVLESDGQDADERYSGLVNRMRRYVSISGLEQRSCTGRLKKIQNVKGVVATLESVFDVHDVDFEDACTFLVPDKWPDCMDFWCDMTPWPDVANRYDEVVSTDCSERDHTPFTARAVLDFTPCRLPDAQIMTYGLAPVPQPSDGLLVDEGSLMVEQKTGFLRVTTTKAVQFDRAFSGEQLQGIMCALGWTEQGRDMMYNCANLPKDDPQLTRRRVPARVSRGGGVRGRTVPDTSRLSTPRRATRGSRQSTGRGATGGSPHRATRNEALTSDIARQTAAAIKACVDDQAAYMEQWADRVADEDYGFQDMADDMARASVRMIKESARIMDLAVRNAQLGAAGARARRDREAAGAAEPDDDEERP